MKDTALTLLKSKTIWAVIALQMVIAFEPYIPLLKEYLPTEFGYIATIVLPVAIVWAKIVRDKGILSNVLATPKQEEVVKAVKKTTKKAVRKKVEEKIGDQLEK